MNHPPSWHAVQALEERTVLDQWTRAQRTPEQPWANPFHDVLTDLRALIRPIPVRDRGDAGGRSRPLPMCGTTDLPPQEFPHPTDPTR